LEAQMNNRTKLGLNILEAALLLGVLGDALLRATPWGLNVLLWTAALVAAMHALRVRFGGRGSWRADGGWLLLPIGFFAAAFAWRDSGTLKLLDGLALFVALALLAWRARGREIRLGRVGDYVLGLGHAAFDVMLSSLPLICGDVRWATIPRNGVMRHAWAAARGLVIAVPLLLVFCALLMAADAVFAGIMRQTFQLDVNALFSHFFLALMFAWMTGGFLRGMMLSEETPRAVSEAVPVACTSITSEDERRHGAPATGAAHEAGLHAHREPPGSVVVEGGAAAADGRSGVGGETPDGDIGEKLNAGIGEKPSVGIGEKNVGIGEKPEGEAGSGVAGAREDAREQAGGATMDAAQAASSRGFSLGAVEVGVVLGLLNVLFACFVAVQFRYFFGGAARVMSITELTYSEYARRGFFELTWVAGLVLPLLLGAHALLRKNSPAAGRIFRPLAGAQIALLFVIMASAVARMRLYQSEYGLTELRLYTTAFMLWLGLVFVWFAWTVLVRGERERFACGALIAAFVTAGLLHFANPDAYIVRANAAPARAGRSFDAAYAASLSADAVPALLSALPSLSRDERCVVARELSQRRTHNALDEDWRAWNFARWRARRALATHHDALSAASCTPPADSVPVNISTSAPEPPPPPTPTTNVTNAGATNATPAGAMNATPAGVMNATPAGAMNATPAGAMNGEANTATVADETLRMITETRGATAGASKAAQATRRGDGKTKQRARVRGAKRAKTR
jgi:hypothetical protein